MRHYHYTPLYVAFGPRSKQIVTVFPSLPSIVKSFRQYLVSTRLMLSQAEHVKGNNIHGPYSGLKRAFWVLPPLAQARTNGAARFFFLFLSELQTRHPT